MTTYRTGNAIGSADPRDLYDNAENLDELVNSQSKLSHPDRLGVSRKTWHGMEEEFVDAQADKQQRFNLLLANSGYEYLADYAAGIEITEYNQVLRDTAGELWRAAATTTLPYTTDGTGLPEGGAFVAVGDADIRNDLAAGVGAGKGGLLVAGAVIYVDTISDLQALDTSGLVDGQRVQVTSTGRAGDFVWREGDYSSELALDAKNGIYVSGNPEIGSWVRVIYNNSIMPEWFGVEDGSINADSFNACQDMAVELKANVVTNLRNIQIGSNHYIAASSSFKGLRLSGGSLKIISKNSPQILSAEGVSGLSEFSTNLSGSIVPGLAGKYVHISNENEVLTERYNPPGNNIPYYKNTAIRVINENGDFYPSLDMGFSDLSGTTIKVFDKEEPITVSFDEAIYETVSASIHIERDSTRLYCGVLSSTSDPNATIVVSANDCHVFDADLGKATSSGQGYGISVGLSCDTYIKNCKGAGSRAPIDGRHGANVTIENCSADATCGSHWGNVYRFINCHLSWIHYSGKDLYVSGGTGVGNLGFGSDAYFITSRSDLSYVFGRLVVENIDLGEGCRCILRDYVYPQNFSSSRRMFDEINIQDVRTKGVDGTSFRPVTISHATSSANVVDIPSKIYISRVDCGKSWFNFVCTGTRSNKDSLFYFDRVESIPSGGNVEIDIYDNEGEVSVSLNEIGFSDNPFGDGLTVRISDNGGQTLSTNRAGIRQAFLSNASPLIFRAKDSSVALVNFPRAYRSTVGNVKARLINCYISGASVVNSFEIEASIGNIVTPSTSDYPVSPAYFVSPNFLQDS